MSANTSLFPVVAMPTKIATIRIRVPLTNARITNVCMKSYPIAGFARPTKIAMMTTDVQKIRARTENAFTSRFRAVVIQIRSAMILIRARLTNARTTSA